MTDAVFAHFDPQNRVADYVVYYLNQLLNCCDRVVVVSNAALTEAEQTKVRALGCELICRDNLGYDFSAYRTGILSLNNQSINDLIICNDSVYGPFYSLQSLIKEMQQGGYDFWGISDSQDSTYHLQSYFIYFNRDLVNTHTFKTFWDNITTLDSKQAVIDQYETGLTSYFTEQGYQAKAYVSMENSATHMTSLRERYRAIKESIQRIKTSGLPDKMFSKLLAVKNPKVNTTLDNWEHAILDYDMPFMKRSLFSNKQNEVAVLARLQTILNRKSFEYPAALIESDTQGRK